MTDKPIADILRDAESIAATIVPERPLKAFPCVVCESLDDADPKRLSLVIHDGFPVFVYPKGARPG